MNSVDPVDIEDPASLRTYLSAAGHVRAGEAIEMRILAGGVSNRTVLVARDGGDAWVLKQALPKLRTAVDWFSDPARIRRETLGLKWLPQLAPHGAITPLVFDDPNRFILAMRAVPQPHENWKSMLLAQDVRSDHIRQFGEILGSIHRRAAERSTELASLFDDRTFFQSLRIEPYYVYTAMQVSEASGFLNELIDETRATRFTLVHGDYSPKNILVHHDQLILLDHEVIHWGDGAFDLGFAMSHLLSKAHHIIECREVFRATVIAFWSAYRSARVIVEDGVEVRAVRHALGCLLARVAGRSTLEYLDDAERRRQAQAVLALMHEPPQTIRELADCFVREIEAR